MRLEKRCRESIRTLICFGTFLRFIPCTFILSTLIVEDRVGRVEGFYVASIVITTSDLYSVFVPLYKLINFGFLSSLCLVVASVTNGTEGRPLSSFRHKDDTLPT